MNHDEIVERWGEALEDIPAASRVRIQRREEENDYYVTVSRDEKKPYHGYTRGGSKKGMSVKFFIPLRDLQLLLDKNDIYE